MSNQYPTQEFIPFNKRKHVYDSLFLCSFYFRPCIIRSTNYQNTIIKKVITACLENIKKRKSNIIKKIVQNIS